MYVVEKRWKARDVNGQLRKGGERIELSGEDAERLLKNGVIREVSHNANDDAEPETGPDINKGDGESEDDDTGDDTDDTDDDGGSLDGETDDANDVSAAPGDIPVPGAETPDDGTGKKPKPQTRRGR